MISSLRAKFMDGASLQASPASMQVYLGDYLPIAATDEVDLFIRRMEPVTIVNPHIWNAAAKNLRTDLFHYAVRLVGLLTDKYDSTDAHIEDIFEDCNEQATLHFSVDGKECQDVIKALVVPCHPRGGYAPYPGRVVKEPTIFPVTERDFR